MIRPFEIKDTQALLDIYNYYVLNTIVTFDVEPLTLSAFEAKLTRINNKYPVLIFEDAGELLGYAYGSKWRPKPAYSKTVETTVYIKNGFGGRQIGSKLYEALLDILKRENYHIALGGLTLPNAASVKLHEKFGFEKVAHFKQVGRKFDTWLDVGFWQLKLH